MPCPVHSTTGQRAVTSPWAVACCCASRCTTTGSRPPPLCASRGVLLCASRCVLLCALRPHRCVRPGSPPLHASRSVRW